MSIIKVKEATMVCPAEDTPSHSLWLSKLDMIGSPYSHCNVIFVFPNISNSPNFFDTNVLKEALSRILVPFYPMAGRLKFNDEHGRYEIDCNAKGAIFIEAETTMPLVVDDDFGDKYMSPDSEIGKQLFPTCDYSQELSSFPLLLVQLTRFECGGVCLGFAQHHHVADGSSHLHFIYEWSRLTKGLDVAVHSVHDRATYLAPRQPSQVKFRHLEYEPSIPALIPQRLDSLSSETVTETECVFNVTKDQIDALKLQATSEGELSYKLSTFEVLSGHVWRTACKARGLADDQDTKLIIPTNGRSRLKDPALPQGFCGNVMFFSVCVEKAGNVIHKPLWYVANKIHKALKIFDDIEYVRSSIDYVESHPDLTILVANMRGRDSFTCPNLSINSWARLPCYDADFGWGVPKLVTATRIKSEGKSFINSSSNGDGSFSVVIKLFTPHMALFKNYLYDI